MEAQGLRYVEADYGQRPHGCKPSTNETKAVDLCSGLFFVNKDGLIHYFDKDAFVDLRAETACPEDWFQSRKKAL